MQLTLGVNHRRCRLTGVEPCDATINLAVLPPNRQRNLYYMIISFIGHDEHYDGSAFLPSSGERLIISVLFTRSFCLLFCSLGDLICAAPPV